MCGMRQSLATSPEILQGKMCWGGGQHNLLPFTQKVSNKKFLLNFKFIFYFFVNKKMAMTHAKHTLVQKPVSTNSDTLAEMRSRHTEIILKYHNMHTYDQRETYKCMR